MKAGLTSSVVLHTAVIALGLFSFSAPKAFDVQDTESFPVDIVPIESITQIQQGDKTAPISEKAAPKPTTKPDDVPDAENVGDQSIDTKTPPRPDNKPKPVETAEEPKAQPEPVKTPEVKPEPKPEPAPTPKPEPVPAPEVQAKPEPKQEAKPDPVEEAAVQPAETAKADLPKLPEKVPTPQTKPKPPQTQTAKTASAQTKQSKNDALADEVAALLNKEKAAGGGARRSTDQASLGGRRNTGGAKLTQSEMDALRGAISKCWNVPAGVADAPGLVVTVRMHLTETGEIKGAPQVTSGGGDSGVGRAAAESAKRAVLRCAPYNLPRDKYDSWSEVIVNFDPSNMF